MQGKPLARETKSDNYLPPQPVEDRRASPPDNLPRNTRQTYDPKRTLLPHEEDCMPIPSSEEISTAIDSCGSIYQLRVQIGQGGMGEVWEAVQPRLGRVVAVKRLRQDRMSELRDQPSRVEFVEALFRQEAATTACLEHPNIVPVHDLGADESGQPLLAMKRVRGRPWDRIIEDDFPRLSPAEFLAKHIPILVSMSRAVAFAHSRGVVHRDLKPSQIMVGEFGEVVLMDWGLSVLFDETLLQREVDSESYEIAPSTTKASNPAGTLAFMAPEQTDKNALCIGPWTDVYLLGGTLYYLLTGRLPHEGENEREVFFKAQVGAVVAPHIAAPKRDIPAELVSLMEYATAPEIQHRMQSTAEFLAALEDYLSGATRQRESMRIAKAVRKGLSGAQDYRLFGELAARLTQSRALWLENPEAAQLEEELHAAWSQLAARHGDLVLATVQAEFLPEGPRRTGLIADIATANVRKMRHRRQRVWAMRIAGVLAAGLIGSGMVFISRLTSEQASTEEARTSAEDLVDFMMSGLGDDLRTLGQLSLMDDVALRALNHYRNIARRDPRGRVADEAYKGLNRAGDLFEELGNGERAEEAYGEALRLAEGSLKTGVGKQWPTWLDHVTEQKMHLASIYGESGRRKDAERFYQEAVANYKRMEGTYIDADTLLIGTATAEQHLAEMQHSRGDLKGSAEALKRIEDKLRPVVEGDRENIMAMAALTASQSERATILVSQGDTEGALALFYSSEKIIRSLMAHDNRDHWKRQFAKNQTFIARILRLRGDLPGAEGRSREALSVISEIAAKDRTQLALQWEEGIALNDLATYLKAQQKIDQALELFIQSMDRMKLVTERNPKNTIWRRNYAAATTTVANTLALMGRSDEALEKYRQANVITRELIAADPSVKSNKQDLAVGEGYIGNILAQTGKLEEALEQFRKARTLFGELSDFDPSNLTPARDIAVADSRIGSTLVDIGRFDESIKSYQSAQTQLRRITGKEGDVPRWRRDEAITHQGLALNWEAKGDLRRALEEADAYVDAMRQLIATEKGNPGWMADLAAGLRTRARIQTALGMGKEASDAIQEALAIFEAMGPPEKLPKDVSLLFTSSLNVASDVALAIDNDAARAEELSARAIAFLASDSAEGNANIRSAECLGAAYVAHGEALLSQFKFTEAGGDADLAILALEEAVKSGLGGMEARTTLARARVLAATAAKAAGEDAKAEKYLAQGRQELEALAGKTEHHDVLCGLLQCVGRHDDAITKGLVERLGKQGFAEPHFVKEYQ